MTPLEFGFEVAELTTTGWAFEHPGFWQRDAPGQTDGWDHFLSVDPDDGAIVLDEGGDQGPPPGFENVTVDVNGTPAEVATRLDALSRAFDGADA